MFHLLLIDLALLLHLTNKLVFSVYCTLFGCTNFRYQQRQYKLFSPTHKINPKLYNINISHISICYRPAIKKYWPHKIVEGGKKHSRISHKDLNFIIRTYLRPMFFLFAKYRTNKDCMKISALWTGHTKINLTTMF